MPYYVLKTSFRVHKGNFTHSETVKLSINCVVGVIRVPCTTTGKNISRSSNNLSHLNNQTSAYCVSVKHLGTTLLRSFIRQSRAGYKSRHATTPLLDLSVYCVAGSVGITNDWWKTSIHQWLSVLWVVACWCCSNLLVLHCLCGVVFFL